MMNNQERVIDNVKNIIKLGGLNLKVMDMELQVIHSKSY